MPVQNHRHTQISCWNNHDIAASTQRCLNPCDVISQGEIIGSVYRVSWVKLQPQIPHRVQSSRQQLLFLGEFCHWARRFSLVSHSNTTAAYITLPWFSNIKVACLVIVGLPHSSLHYRTTLNAIFPPFLILDFKVFSTELVSSSSGSWSSRDVTAIMPRFALYLCVFQLGLGLVEMLQPSRPALHCIYVCFSLVLV